ncbi:MAG: GIY-YIG nuclease family protein [bacterium]
MPWRVYILQCKDGKLYTGITNDLGRRLKEHSSGRGCRFTKYRTPVELVYSQKAKSRPQALRLEVSIKRMPRQKKLELIISQRKL